MSFFAKVTEFFDSVTELLTATKRAQVSSGGLWLVVAHPWALLNVRARR